MKLLLLHVKSKMKTSEEAGVSKSIQAVFDPGLGLKALKTLESIMNLIIQFQASKKMFSRTKRSKYPAKFKLKVIEFTEKSNNVAAGREYGVSEKLVRDWRRDAEKIKTMPKNKSANCGKSCQWPELEKQLTQWKEDQRKSGFVVTRNLATT